MSDPRRQFATEVVARLRDAGVRALWAGGCVRDLLMGRDPSDYDVATEATPEQVMRLFRRTVPVGVSFGVVRVLGPKEAGEVEVATFRSDGAYVDGRRPESVVFGSPEEDASRRDFTINGMFLDPLSGEVLDFVGGRSDLEARILRAIGDPAARFAEDKLRLLRAARFAARFDLRIEPATRSALEAMADRVRVVAPERIAQELRRMLVHPSRARGMALAMDVGLIAAILPPVAALKGASIEEPDGDPWDHTLRALDHLPANPSFPLALATLLHRVGRTHEDAIEEGRDLAGRRIADELGRALRLSNAERERVAWLVEHHRALRAAKAMRPSRLKRLLAAPGIEELLALHRADALASGGDIGPVEYCEWYLNEEPAGPIDPPPLLTGRDLADRGVPSGPAYARLLAQAREAQLDGLIRTKDDALAWLDRSPESHPEAR